MKKIILFCLCLGLNLSVFSQSIVIEGALSSCGVQQYHISNFSYGNIYTWIPVGGTLINSTQSSALIQWNNTPSSALKVISTNYFTGQQNQTILYLKECCDVQTFSDYVIYDGQNASDLIALNNGSNNLSFKTIVINGDFILDESINSNQSRFLLSPEAKISVENSSTFYAFETEFVACSEKMWGSVSVKSGTLEIDKCRFKDGYESIKTIANTPPVLLKVKNSNFLNNYVNIVAYDDISSQSYIKNNDFSTFGFLKFPFNGQSSSLYGINTTSVSNLTIGGINEGNRFSNMDVGVISYNSNINVVGNTFYDCESSIENYSFSNSENINFEAEKNTIVNSTKGITVQSSNAIIKHNRLRDIKFHINLNFLDHSIIEIFGNDLRNDHFSSSAMGITFGLTNQMSSNVYGNEIENIGYSIYCLENFSQHSNNNFVGNCITNSEHAFQITGLEGVNIEENKIKNSYHCGITCNHSRYSYVYRNDIDGKKYNLSEYGLRISLSPYSFIHKNIMNDFKTLNAYWGYTPVMLRNNVYKNGLVGVNLQSGGHIGQQGSFSSPSDNRWLYPFGSLWSDRVELYVDTDGADGSNSPFFMRYGYPTFAQLSFGENPDKRIPKVVAYGNFPLAQVTAPYTCLYGVFNPTEPISPFPNNIIDYEAMSINPYESLSNYTRQQQLLDDLSANPQLSNINPYSSFIQNTQNNTSMFIIRQMQNAANNGDYSLAEQLANQIDDENIIENTARQVYSILFDNLQDSFPFTNLSESEINQIISLSQLCPNTHGYAVRVARYMAYLIGEPLQCLHECENIKIPNFTSARLADRSPIQIYPNPAHDEVFLKSSVNGRIQIANVMGQVQIEIESINQDVEHRIDLSLFSKGIYIINVFNTAQELVESQKLIVQ